LSSWWWAVCCPKHVEKFRNIGIINSTTRLHLFGSFYEIYIMTYGSMNIMTISWQQSALWEYGLKFVCFQGNY
jgi:hypothetical protein